MSRLAGCSIASLYSVCVESSATCCVKLQAANLFGACEFDVLAGPANEVAALHFGFIGGDSKRGHHIHRGVHQDYRGAENLGFNRGVDAALDTVYRVGKWFGREVSHAAHNSTTLEKRQHPTYQPSTRPVGA